MTNKHEKDQGQSTRTDDLISDYLGDLLGHSIETVPISEFFSDNEADTLGCAEYESPLEIQRSSQSRAGSGAIKSGFFLVPTIKLLSDEDSNHIYCREDAVLILLNNLYFLRRPLSPRVRQCFLDLSERVIDDYHASDWKAQVSRQGILREAR